MPLTAWEQRSTSKNPLTLVKHGIGTLADRAPGIQALRVGENFSENADGYTHGLIITFKSRQALDRYISHPEHTAVSDPLRRDADLRVMDFEY